MEEVKNNKMADPMIERLFSIGAHFALSRSRRHPSVSPYIFGHKNRVEIFDLEKTKALLEKTLVYVRALGASRKVVLFASGKSEGREIVRRVAEELSMPFIAGRWIGGTLTNFSEIRGRIDRLETLRGERERGEFAKYTKKERLMLDREIERLSKLFAGLVPLKGKPDAIFVVDAKREHIAVAEAKRTGVPVIALSSSDCNLADVTHPILGNDSAVASIEFFLREVSSAYKAGVASAPAPSVAPAPATLAGVKK
jgi:small subunit ribosomal protein S2